MDTLERAKQARLEGLRLAEERLSAPGVREASEQAHRVILSRFFRMFAGTEDMTKSKGHVPCIVVSVETMREWRKTHPATHVWAEHDEKFLDMGDL